MYHHIASLAHEAIASESGDSLLPRLRSVEARLAALEAAKAEIDAEDTIPMDNQPY